MTSVEHAAATGATSPVDEGADARAGTRPDAVSSSSAQGPPGSGGGYGPPTWSDVRIPYAAKLMLALCAIAFGVILYESRQLDFSYDEWSFVGTATNWHLRDYFVPHNEHWSTIPMVIYKIMLKTVGMHSYLPYMALLLLLHVSAAFLLFLIIRRRCGDLLGLCAGGILLFFGRGYENLLWAFQVSFLGSVTFGLLALYLLGGRPVAGRWRAAGGSAALLAALMSSGMGLFFLVAVTVDLALDRERRRLLWVSAAPGLAYVSWYLAFGRQGTASDPSIFQLKILLGLAEFVPVGVGTAAAGVFALVAAWAPAALLLLIASALVLWYRKRRDSGIAVAAAVAVVLEYSLIGLVRQRYGLVEATSSRYIYIGAVFVLLILTEALRDLRWRGLWRTVAPITAVGIMAAGAGVLVGYAHQRTQVLSVQKYELQITWLFRDAPGLQHDAAIDRDLLPVVTPSLYVATRQHYGSPLNVLTATQLSTVPTQVTNNALRVLMPVRLSQPLSSPQSGACPLAIRPGGHADLTVPGGSQASVKTVGAHAPSHVILNTWYRGNAPDGGDQRVDTTTGHDLRVSFPDTGLGLKWHVRITNTGGNQVLVCRKPSRN